MTSNPSAAAYTAPSSTKCGISGSSGRSSRRAFGTSGTSRAPVTESADANSVTAWPRRTCSSVKYETTRSVPP